MTSSTHDGGVGGDGDSKQDIVMKEVRDTRLNAERGMQNLHNLEYTKLLWDTTLQDEGVSSLFERFNTILQAKIIVGTFFGAMVVQELLSPPQLPANYTKSQEWAITVFGVCMGGSAMMFLQSVGMLVLAVTGAATRPQKTMVSWLARWQRYISLPSAMHVLALLLFYVGVCAGCYLAYPSPSRWYVMIFTSLVFWWFMVKSMWFGYHTTAEDMDHLLQPDDSTD